MRVTELWHYPVKSMRGEQLDDAVLTDDGVTGDRLAHVYGPRGVLTARTRPRLLGLAGTLGPDGEPLVNGRPW
ncbi:MAG: MOSC N-terminal beta barrel domain-containing protein, partial [Pseudonocardiaceae bacterium]